MSLAASILIAAAVAASPSKPVPDFTAEASGIRVETAIASQVFTWTVTNVDAEPIRSFSMPVYRGYNYLAPEGWWWDDADARFYSEATERGDAIEVGESASFEMRAGSSGPTLRVTPLTLTTVDGAECTVEIWAPGPRLKSTSLTVAGTMAILALMWVGLQALSDRRRASSA